MPNLVVIPIIICLSFLPNEIPFEVSDNTTLDNFNKMWGKEVVLKRAKAQTTQGRISNTNPQRKYEIGNTAKCRHQDVLFLFQLASRCWYASVQLNTTS